MPEDRPVQRGQVPPPWRKFTKPEEDQRLALLDERIARKSAILADVVDERKRLMQRAIRRMRRAQGKE